MFIISFKNDILFSQVHLLYWTCLIVGGELDFFFSLKVLLRKHCSEYFTKLSFLLRFSSEQIPSVAVKGDYTGDGLSKDIERKKA